MSRSHRTILKRTFTAVFLIAFGACPARAAETNAVVKPTRAILESTLKKHNLPALAVVVVKGGQICDLEAVGIRKAGNPMPVTTNDLFHIGSCTKSMTATLSARLVEEGKVEWDTTISSVFPELKGKMNNAYEKVTLEQLLTHRGGVPGSPPKFAWARAWMRDGTPAQQRYRFIKAVLNSAPESTPGAKWIYSNSGYAIAGAMLEKKTGTAWETLMTNYVFKPLHMSSAGFGPPGTKDKVDQPWGHTRLLKKNTPDQIDNPPAIGPAGTVHSSLADLARYAVFHMEKTNGLLKAETVRRLHTPPQGGDYACGWGCSKNPEAGSVLTHAGSNGSFYLFMWLAPEKNLAVVTATNIGGEPAENSAVEVTREMIKKWL